MRLTDIHQHLLWGMDDGPADAQTMQDMLWAAHRQGIDKIAATPHACPGVQPFDLQLYHQRLAEAQRYCDENHLGIQLLTGAEIAWTYHTVEALRRKQVPTLAGTNYALIELWHNVTWSEVQSAAEQLLRAGFTPVFAHVERYRCFTWQPGKAIELKEKLPVCYQVNASTVLAQRGLAAKHFLSRMLRDRVIDFIASDAHDCHFRPQCLQEAYRILQKKSDPEYAKVLVKLDGV